MWFGRFTVQECNISRHVQRTDCPVSSNFVNILQENITSSVNSFRADERIRSNVSQTGFSTQNDKTLTAKFCAPLLGSAGEDGKLQEVCDARENMIGQDTRPGDFTNTQTYTKKCERETEICRQTQIERWGSGKCLGQ